MRYLADTTYLIDLVDGDEGAVELALEIESYGEEVGLSTISVHEYLRGVYYLYYYDERRLRERLSQALEDVNAFTILPYTLEIASKAAELEVHLIKGGTVISLPDLIIAATALTHNLILITRNVRDFERIPGLKIRRY